MDQKMNREINRDLAWMLIARLERLTADSYWAHQASGLRGSLLRVVEQGLLEPGGVAGQEMEKGLESLIRKGFEVLEKGAREFN
jgi:hypothetical protein